MVWVRFPPRLPHKRKENVMIKQYVRDKKGQKIGLLVADYVLSPNKDCTFITVGHSKWNKKLDKYDTYLAHKIAVSRAWKQSSTLPAHSIRKEYVKFCHRCLCYFKNCVGLSDNVNDIIWKMTGREIT